MMPSHFTHESASLPEGWLDVDLGQGVGALMTSRNGGVGTAPFDSFNVGDHVGDDPAVVAQHRQALAERMGAQVAWLKQVHGNRVVRVDAGLDLGTVHEADGAVCTQPGLACAVMVADCLPILLAAPEGRGVAALHAGWRGLAGAGAMQGRGILEAGVAALCEATACDPADVRAWLGPCIGPAFFEVGADVLQGFGVQPGRPEASLFKPARSASDGSPRWLADLPGLASVRARHLGLQVWAIERSAGCTVAEPSRYFSFRRDRVTGRQVACIWLR